MKFFRFYLFLIFLWEKIEIEINDNDRIFDPIEITLLKLFVYPQIFVA